MSELDNKYYPPDPNGNPGFVMAFGPLKRPSPETLQGIAAAVGRERTELLTSLRKPRRPKRPLPKGVKSI